MTANRSAAVGGWMDGWHVFAWLTTFFLVFVSFICHFSFTTANYFLIIMAADPQNQREQEDLEISERGAAAPLPVAVNVNHDELDRAAVLRILNNQQKFVYEVFV